MNEDAEIRRANLRQISNEPSVLRGRAGGKRGYSYWAGLLNGEKSFGEKVARDIETELGLPRGWLDRADAPDRSAAFPTDKQSLSVAPPAITLAQALANALEVIGQALAVAMPDPVREDVADALAKLARRRGAERDQQQVLHLLNAPPAKRSNAA